MRQRRVESCHRKSTAAHPILKWEGVYKVTEIRALRAQQEIGEGCVCFETKVKEGKTYSRPPPPTQPDAFWSLGAVPSIWHTQRLGVILMVARVELSFCKACQCSVSGLLIHAVCNGAGTQVAVNAAGQAATTKTPPPPPAAPKSNVTGTTPVQI